MARADFTFHHSLRVRWAEADMQGVVFNANYLLYFDVTVTEYWAALTGDRHHAMRELFENVYVVRSIIDYHGPARFDDLIDVCVRTRRIGRTSMSLHFEIHRDSTHLISGENIYVFARDGQSQPWPEEFRRQILAYERVTPET